MYWVADYILFPIVYYIARYRRKMVEKNLRVSFPEHTAAERLKIEKAFYHQLCYTAVEILWGRKASPALMCERVSITGVEAMIRDCQAHGSVVAMLGHLGNWEWAAEVHRELSPYGIEECNVYRRQKNPRIDRWLLETRAKRGGACVEKHELLREMVRRRSKEQQTVYGLICDQKPSPVNQHFWTTFLNQETAFLQGGEVLSKKFGYPVYYAHITRPERGHYCIDMQPICHDVSNAAPGKITEAFARKLEDNIKEQPEIWLWTHNRWKWKKPMNT